MQPLRMAEKNILEIQDDVIMQVFKHQLQNLSKYVDDQRMRMIKEEMKVI